MSLKTFSLFVLVLVVGTRGNVLRDVENLADVEKMLLERATQTIDENGDEVDELPQRNELEQVLLQRAIDLLSEKRATDEQIKKDVGKLIDDWKVYIAEMWYLKFPEQAFGEIAEIFADNWAEADKRPEKAVILPVDIQPTVGAVVQPETPEEPEKTPEGNVESARTMEEKLIPLEADKRYTKEENVEYLLKGMHPFMMKTWGFDFSGKFYQKLYQIYFDEWDSARAAYRVHKLVEDMKWFTDGQWAVKFSDQVYQQIAYIFAKNMAAAKPAK